MSFHQNHTRSFHQNRTSAIALVLLGMIPGGLCLAADVSDLNLGMTPDPAEGYRIILNEPMAAPVMKVSDIDELWKVWEPEERAKAEAASAEERHRMTFDRYGWPERPNDDSRLPLGYTADGKGNLVTNCFVCHGGQLAGQAMPGKGDTLVDLTTIATDVQKLRTLESGGDPSKITDRVAPFDTPLSIHKGTTNAVIFAPVFAALRNPKLAAAYTKDPSLLHHHDMNAPAWWLFAKKEKIYCDAFAPKTPRQLMPFAMSPTFSDEQFHSFEPNFVHIKAYIESLKPPKYPYPIDAKLAAEGKVAFERVCAECHGTYGENASFPNKSIEMDRIGTDPVRFGAIANEGRPAVNQGWLQYHGEHPIDIESKGYIAQPLDGIWATAPYFHNGSVPTIYHVFNVDERPTIWKRDDHGYDEEHVGLAIQEVDAVPSDLPTRLQRAYYNTSVSGASNQGHTFPDDELSKEEKVAVMEYLKTL